MPMQDAFGFSKTQIGILSATFGWVVSGSHIITQINVCRLDDHIGRRVCFFDVTVLRDLYLFVRLLGIGNGLCVLVSVNQSNSRLGVEE